MMNGDYGGIGWRIWLILVLIMLFIYLFTRNSRQYKNERKAKRTIELVKKRYAHGEITKGQFEQMKKDLS